MARILVVEDDADLRALVVRRLGAAGHRVREAPSPLEALALVEASGPPDLAVLDVNMPVMSGLELLVELRRSTAMPDLPAVFLSALVQPEDIEAGRALGAIYLTKPYVTSALHRAIEKLLAARPDAEPEAW